jgi:GMP synthase-like glutamine amidotransferase
MNTRILIVDGSVFPDIYRPTEHWRALAGEVPCDSVHLPSGEAPPDLGAYTHIIITGSERSVVDWEPWYAVEADIIERAVRARKPVLASCFGHQMLARTLSGDRHVRRSETPEFGWASVDLVADDPLFAGLPSPFHVFVSHFDEVCDPPAPWLVLARNGDCAVHAMRYGELPVWGIQAHPEITPAEGRALLEGFLVKVPEKAHIVGPALSREPRDDGLGRVLVERFLRL